MVKTIVSIIVVLCLIVAGAIFECVVVKNQFNEFNAELIEVYDKIEAQTATTDDIYQLQDSWIDKKSFLHAFIPHNEIREFDLWIADAVNFVRNEEWIDALSKMEVLIALSKEAPRSFSMNFSTIF